MSGVTWLNTPDGRKGFASYFLEQGYQVYLLVSLFDLVFESQIPRLLDEEDLKSCLSGALLDERRNSYLGLTNHKVK